MRVEELQEILNRLPSDELIAVSLFTHEDLEFSLAEDISDFEWEVAASKFDGELVASSFLEALTFAVDEQRRELQDDGV